MATLGAAALVACVALSRGWVSALPEVRQAAVLGQSSMKRYVVFHDWGSEGWKPTAECDTVLDAVDAREADIANGGGLVEIFEHIQVLEAYRQAACEQDEVARKAAKAAKA